MPAEHPCSQEVTCSLERRVTRTVGERAGKTSHKVSNSLLTTNIWHSAAERPHYDQISAALKSIRPLVCVFIIISFNTLTII